MSSPEKIVQEKKSLKKLNDFFKRFVVVKDDIKPRTDEQGIVTMAKIDLSYAPYLPFLPDLLYELRLDNRFLFQQDNPKF